MIRESTILGPDGRAFMASERPADSDDFWYTRVVGPSSSGEVITVDSALQLTAVLACVKVLAETLAQIPLKIYRRLPNGGKEEAPDHPVYDLIHSKPNNWQVSFSFREQLQAHLGLEGNAYAEIKSGPRGLVDRIEPLMPNQVRVKQLADTSLAYYVTDKRTHQTRVIDQSRMLHIPGLSYNGITGLTPIGYARETMGVYQATERYGGRLFSSGGTKRIALEHPETVSEPAAKRLRESFMATYGGSANYHKVAILEEGMKATEIGMTAKDAEFLKNREAHVRDIARIYRVPPHMIADLERATFSNIEQQSQEFIQYTMLPWITRWEQAINDALITAKETYFCQFVLDGLLRGDTKSRYEGYASAVTVGWMNRNEVRSLENMNPRPELDEYYEPLNLQAGGSQGGTSDENAASAEPKVNPRPLADDIANRIIFSLCSKLKDRAEHGAEDWTRYTEWAAKVIANQADARQRYLAPFCSVFGGKEGTISALIGQCLFEIISMHETPETAICAIEKGADMTIVDLIMEGINHADL